MKLNALLVDLAVLGDEGWGYLERVCGMLPDLGVVVCTGRSTVAQRVRGLRLGVDDWINKPCHPEEAMARIEAVVAPPPPRPRQRRRRARSSPASWRSAPTSSRPSSAAQSLDLTRREFELLQLLADAEGQVLEREAIYQRVWGYAMAHGDRSVDVFVRKLRRKLEKRSPGWSTSTPTSGSATASTPSRSAASGRGGASPPRSREPAPAEDAAPRRRPRGPRR